MPLPITHTDPDDQWPPPSLEDELQSRSYHPYDTLEAKDDLPDDLIEEPTDTSEAQKLATPKNTLIRETTDRYIALGTHGKKAPATVERELLAVTNVALALRRTLTPLEVKTIISGKTIPDMDTSKPPKKSEQIETLHPVQIAKLLLARHNFCRIGVMGKSTDPEYDLLAMYQTSGPDEGIYVSDTSHFRSMARAYHYTLTEKDFDHVMTVVKDEAPQRYPNKDRDLIAVNNGIFNYETKELMPFNPETVFVAKSSVDYNPNITLPVITSEDGYEWDVETWMQEIAEYADETGNNWKRDEQTELLLWQTIGAVLRPHVRWNKAAFFYSEKGNNGKGTLCELMRNLCGTGAYASIPLDDFGKDFLLEPLIRASAIIVDENDTNTFLDKAGNLKAVITNDVITINRKFKSPVNYQFFGFMVQCLNGFPTISDKTSSFYRRNLFVPFRKSFTGVERKEIKNDYLNRKEVKEYVLAKVLGGADFSLEDYYSFTGTDSSESLLLEFKRHNDPVRAFWEDHAGAFQWDLLPYSFLYDMYKVWFKDTTPSGVLLSQAKFTKQLNALLEEDRLAAMAQGNNEYPWHVTGPTEKPRAGIRMSAPEPLLITYDLKKWMNQTYTGSDEKMKTISSFSGTARGVLRKIPRIHADKQGRITIQDEPNNGFGQ